MNSTNNQILVGSTPEYRPAFRGTSDPDADDEINNIYEEIRALQAAEAPTGGGATPLSNIARSLGFKKVPTHATISVGIGNKTTSDMSEVTPPSPHLLEALHEADFAVQVDVNNPVLDQTRPGEFSQVPLSPEVSAYAAAQEAVVVGNRTELLDGHTKLSVAAEFQTAVILVILQDGREIIQLRRDAAAGANHVN